ncbi:MAG: T9SS type A sorting domain-containing protein [Bacteroidetes bacterium]|nr:T9SS type A sorting domain-containing protein [Bacteroidota bacterium]
MERIFFFAIAILCLNATTIATDIPVGYVSGTWTLAGSPYNVQGSIQIPNDSTLTIQPGVNVIFQGAYKLNVQGRLLAIGTIADTITFTAINTTEGWRGIRFDNTPATNDSSKIVYCKLQYGKAIGTSPDYNGGAVYINNFSKVIIYHSLITKCSANNSAGGVYIVAANPIMSNSTISYNTSFEEGGGISIRSGSPIINDNLISYNSGTNGSININGGGIYIESGNASIVNNTISNNSSTQGGGIKIFGGNSIINNNIISNNQANTGGGIYVQGGNPTISYNTISGNIAQNSGGGIEAGADITITNNIISNNTATSGGGGIRCYTESAIIKFNFICGNTVTSNNNEYSGGGGIKCVNCDPSTDISNNVIANNNAGNGAGLLCYNASPTLTNNILTNNSASNNGGALSCSDGSPIFRNCIIYGNTAATSGTQIYLYDDSSDPKFYYSDIQGGTAAFELNNNFYTGAYQNNIDTDPLFATPSGGSGTGYNGLTADWSLQNSSPCIDAGDPNGIYPSTDIAGNPRKNVCRIDIGAYEYQTGIPSFVVSLGISQPILCNGAATGEITTTVSGGAEPYTYHWSNEQTTPNVSGLVAGNYTVTVSETSYACSIVKSITLTEPIAISIDAGADTTIICGDTIAFITSTNYTGTDPLTYTWSPSVGLSDSTLANPYLTPTSDQVYTVTVTTSDGCVATNDINVTMVPINAPEICIVSVDSSNKNLVTWNKPLSLSIDSFYIYRETITTDVFEKIGSEPYDSMSVFVDNASLPNVQSSRYKISIFDNCGLESNKSGSHKTMHLNINQGMGTTWNLDWEPYEGFIVSSYRILRGTSPDSLQLIGTTSGGSTQFSDFTSPAGYIYYQVEVVSPNFCNPSKSYSSSRSNIATNNPNGIYENTNTSDLFSFYPNPATDKIQVFVKQKSGIEIMNAVGQMLKSINAIDNNSNIDISGFARGIYYIKVKSVNGIIVKKFIKE